MSLKSAIQISTLLAILIALIFVSPHFKQWLDNQSQTISLSQLSACDLTDSSCTVSLNDSSQIVITLMNGASSQTMSAVVIKGEMPVSAKLLIEGRDMFMGTTHHTFKQTLDNTFALTELVVPACTIDPGMIWLYRLQMDVDGKVYEYVFEVNNKFHSTQVKGNSDG